MLIPQGWSKFYEFSLSDLRAGASIIDRLCATSGTIVTRLAKTILWDKQVKGRGVQIFVALVVFDQLLILHTETVQWDFMHGLMENAIYGGRVDNTYDMRVLTSYLVQFFNSTVLSGHVSLLPLPWEPNHCEYH